jgi:hypothetical protein
LNQTTILRAKLAAARFWLTAIALKQLLGKANFDPNQPRVPRGNRDGGRWTRIGSASGAPDGDPPKVPKEKPLTGRARNAVIKSVARWLLRASPAGRIINVIEIGSWLYEYSGYITAYLDDPRTLAELQAAVADPKTGYDIHHIVEQTPARQDGFPESLIEGSDNLVRISTLKHWEVTTWFNTRNDDYGGQSPGTTCAARIGANGRESASWR